MWRGNRPFPYGRSLPTNHHRINGRKAPSMSVLTTPAAKDTQQLDFMKFWTGETISNLGSSFTQFAIPLLVFKLTGSALNLGIATALTYLPYLLFGLVIGAWVDRANRKRLMILVDIGQ